MILESNKSLNGRWKIENGNNYAKCEETGLISDYILLPSNRHAYNKVLKEKEF